MEDEWLDMYMEDRLSGGFVEVEEDFDPWYPEDDLYEEEW